MLSQHEFSSQSQSLPPLRALALRDCILRRTGFIEKTPDASPANEALLAPPFCEGEGPPSELLAARQQ